MGQERFWIRPPTNDGVTYGGGPDFDRWRTEMFAQVNISRTVKFLQPLLVNSPHRFWHIGLSAECDCGWKERRFWSPTAAACAWWEHAEPLLDWDQIEAELVVRTLAREGL